MSVDMQFMSHVILQKPLYAAGRTLSTDVLADCNLSNYPVRFCTCWHGP